MKREEKETQVYNTCCICCNYLHESRVLPRHSILKDQTCVSFLFRVIPKQWSISFPIQYMINLILSPA